MKKVTIITAFVSACLFQACGDGGVSRKLQRFMGSQVNFPASLQLVAGRDVRPFEIEDSKAHILIYYDSTACGTCLVGKLPEWDPLIDSVATICPDADFVFVMSPKAAEYKAVLRAVIINGAGRNVALDRAGDFIRDNPHIPNDDRFHTFLLDRNGKVLLAGSPLHNPGLWALYKDMLARIDDGRVL